MSRLCAYPLLLVLASLAIGQTRPPAGWTPRVRTELTSDLIVRGRIFERDQDRLEHAIVVGGSYVRLEIEIREVLKGAFSGSRVPLTFFAAPPGHPHGYVPTAEDMRGLIGQERIFYLLCYTSNHFFLADRFGRSAVRIPTPAVLEEVRRSTAHHELLATSAPPPDPQLAREIQTLLDYALEGPDAQLRAFIQLDSLGIAAIPTLVHFLDDDRPLATTAMLLQETSGERIPVLREYGPELISDAICTLMHQRTRESFGLDYAHPKPGQRDREHERWRIYAHYVATDPSMSPADELLRLRAAVRETILAQELASRETAPPEQDGSRDE